MRHMCIISVCIEMCTIINPKSEGSHHSCKDVFKLLLGHMGQMAINAFVQRLLHAIQSWGIPFLSGWVAYEVLGILGVGTRMYAVALIFLMSVFFSRMFASVFETTIDCIFVCAFRDEDVDEMASLLELGLRAGVDWLDVETETLSDRGV